MNFYEIGYYTHEESEFIQLQHEATFSEDELEEMIISVAKEATSLSREVLLKDVDNILGEVTDREEDYKTPKDFMNYAIVNWAVGRLLCTKYGFSPLIITSSWYVQGWNNVYKPTWLEHHSSEGDSKRITRFSKAVGEE